MFLLDSRSPEHVRAALLKEVARLESLVHDLRRIADGHGPQPADLETAPVLTRWCLTSRHEPCIRALGRGHPHLPDGPAVASGICAIDRSAGWVRTIGRFFVLKDEVPLPSRWRGQHRG